MFVFLFLIVYFDTYDYKNKVKNSFDNLIQNSNIQYKEKYCERYYCYLIMEDLSSKKFDCSYENYKCIQVNENFTKY